MSYGIFRHTEMCRVMHKRICACMKMLVKGRQSETLTWPLKQHSSQVVAEQVLVFMKVRHRLKFWLLQLHVFLHMGSRPGRSKEGALMARIPEFGTGSHEEFHPRITRISFLLHFTFLTRSSVRKIRLCIHSSPRRSCS